MKQNTYNNLARWHNFKLKLVIEGIAVGLVTGLIVVIYRYLLGKSEILIGILYKTICEKPLYILPWVIFLLIIGYVVGLMVKKDPMISGSGIPQVEGVLLRKLDMNWWKVIIGKFVGGVLAIGAGLSLGREGPSVQLGAAVGQGFSRIFKRLKIEEKYLITSGASAGLAAAFNAPIAGALFALEEVHKNFSPLVLISALSAALSSDFICSEFLGLKPVITLNNLHALPLKYYGYIVILGIIIGVAGVIFNKGILKTQNLYGKQKWLPKEFRIIVPLMVSIFVGILLPEALGGGNNIITAMLSIKYAILVLVILLIVKFLFTMICYGSGAPGGIFLPMLAIGAIIGNIYGISLAHFFGINTLYINNFIILAMAAYFTAVVKSPITGTILITEMTGSFTHLLSLSVASICAYIVADLLGSKPIYEELLERYLKNQGEEVEAISDKNKTISEFVVEIGSKFDNKKVKEVELPSQCLLVAVKRGETEIIPKGDTVIFPGDYLVVLSDDNKAAKINDIMVELTIGEKSINLGNR